MLQPQPTRTVHVSSTSLAATHEAHCTLSRAIDCPMNAVYSRSVPLTETDTHEAPPIISPYFCDRTDPSSVTIGANHRNSKAPAKAVDSPPASDSPLGLPLNSANPFAEPADHAHDRAQEPEATVSDTQRLHDVESFFPLDFHMDWDDRANGGKAAVSNTDSRAEDATDALAARPRVAPRHVGTTLLGIAPIPKWLVSLDLSMAMHDDGEGWDLAALVYALGGSVRLVGYEGSMRMVEVDETGVGRYMPSFHYVVLFDGVCNLCNKSVDFIIRHDPEQRFLFVAQQDAAAAKLLELHGHTLPDSSEMDSVLVLTPDGQLHERSTAALQAGAGLSGLVGTLLSTLSTVSMTVVPTFLMDPLYGFVGRNRYKWFGQKETCRVPTPEERRRFL